MSSNEQKYIIKQNLHKLKINQHNVKVHIRRGQRTTSLSASDEGIVMDYGEEMARKRRVSSATFFYLLPFSRNNFLLCVMLITNIANWSDEKLSVAEYKKKKH